MESAEAIIFENRSKWTRERFDRVVELGAFAREKVELVRGELVEMAPQGLPHSNTVAWLTNFLAAALSGRAMTRAQLPLVIDEDTEVEPDIALVEPITHRKSQPMSAYLVVEVATSSERYDRVVKAPLYSEAGVEEYWIVNTVELYVEVFSNIRDGRYQTIERHFEGALTVPHFRDVTVQLSQLFG